MTRRGGVGRWALAAALGLASLGGVAGAEEPVKEDVVKEEEEGGYGKKGQLEAGGGLDMVWSSDLYILGLTPTIGYFILDRVELSLRVTGTYQNEKNDDGTRSSSTIGSIVLEPSYHLPLQDKLDLFGGLGIGVAYDGDHTEFDVLPRAGFNIQFGRSGVLTPALRVPILTGRGHGGDGDDIGVSASIGFELGITTTF